MTALIDILKKGSTSRAISLRIVDATTGAPVTSAVYNSAGIALWYRRTGGLKVAITPASLTALTDAWASGGFLHISDGVYRFDVPDAAFATGSNHVEIGGTITGMVVLGGRVRLVDYDPEDTVRLGLTALPNATPAGAGGLPTCDANNSVKIQTGLKKNQALNAFEFVMTDASTGALVAGKTVTATRSIDGGAYATGTLGAVTDLGNGSYKIDLPAADLNGTVVTVKFSATGCADNFTTFVLEP